MKRSFSEFLVWRTNPRNWHLRSGERFFGKKILHRKRTAFLKAPANKRNILENMLGCWAQKKGKPDHLKKPSESREVSQLIHKDCPNPILENWNGNQNPSKMDGKSQFVMSLLAQRIWHLQMNESQLLQISPQPELNLLDFIFILGSFIKKLPKSVSQDTYRFIS